MRIVTVLKSGPEYRPEHAIWLAKQINEHNPGVEIVCLTDMGIRHPLIRSIPLIEAWEGWWSKINLFSDLLDGDIFYMDIDTVVRGPLDSFFNQPKTTFLEDFYKHHLLGSGLMYIRQQDKARIWNDFIKNPAFHMAQNRTRRFWGDQGYYSRHFNDFNLWQKVLPGKVVSYKVHCRNRPLPPPGTSIVCFHGNPRPWAAGAKWVPKL